MASQPDAPNTILDTVEGKRLFTAQAPGLAPMGAVCQRPAMGHGSGDSEGGAAWDYLPHDHARSRAYRWGEDAIGGYSDEGQRWCLGVALWNERDPILKERLWRQRGHADTYVEWPKAEKEDHSVISSADASPTAAFPQARSFGLW